MDLFKLIDVSDIKSFTFRLLKYFFNLALKALSESQFKTNPMKDSYDSIKPGSWQELSSFLDLISGSTSALVLVSTTEGLATRYGGKEVKRIPLAKGEARLFKRRQPISGKEVWFVALVESGLYLKWSEPTSSSHGLSMADTRLTGWMPWEWIIIVPEE